MLNIFSKENEFLLYLQTFFRRVTNINTYSILAPGKIVILMKQVAKLSQTMLNLRNI